MPKLRNMIKDPDVTSEQLRKAGQSASQQEIQDAMDKAKIQLSIAKEYGTGEGDAEAYWASRIIDLWSLGAKP
jgi:hypothetical protein